MMCVRSRLRARPNANRQPLIRWLCSGKLVSMTLQRSSSADVCLFVGLVFKSGDFLQKGKLHLRNQANMPRLARLRGQ